MGGQKTGGWVATRKDSHPPPSSKALRALLRSDYMSWCQVDAKASQAKEMFRPIRTLQDFPFNAAGGDGVALGEDTSEAGNAEVK